MRQRFIFTENAETQLLEIIDYVAAESEAAAIRLRATLYEALSRLADMPEMGHRREDLTDRPVRFWSVYSYLIVYDPASTPLTVIAVLHGARDVERLIEKI